MLYSVDVLQECVRVCVRVRARKCGRKAPLVTSQVLFRNTMGGEIALMEKRLM